MHSKQIMDCTSVGTHDPEDMNELKQKSLPLTMQYCKFKVQEIQAGVVTILADNNRYWTRINRNGRNYIEAEGTAVNA